MQECAVLACPSLIEEGTPQLYMLHSRIAHEKKEKASTTNSATQTRGVACFKSRGDASSNLLPRSIFKYAVLSSLASSFDQVFSLTGTSLNAGIVTNQKGAWKNNWRTR
eukprot:CAMPEP_0172883876 /NCGR_PEP_ID=MMETSP1075-20121228/123740_1 /TAXON_ID=2916 /ORGANISM="Ceratium fusus, Strain PA161109" /LENGTH=108 /DNA_ID=CAMNT_0013736859 /DNA_START=838 /DNA_END=1164 /DNA_ORIENTATION=-